MTTTVPDILREAAKTYEARNAAYGDSYKRHGWVMAALFPHGIMLRAPEDHARFGVLTMIVGKLTRYCRNNPGGTLITTGEGIDSAHDLSVYAAMLEELERMP